MSGPLAPVPSGLLARASELLLDGEYRPVPDAASLPWPTSNARVFEDPFGVVGIAVFDTWQELDTDWPDAQAAVVELLSEHVSAGEPKAWEGYLVLLTPGSAGDDRRALERIRYDVSRLRKLIADGVDLEEVGALERLLAPLLPLGSGPALDRPPDPPLELLRRELESRAFEPGPVARLIDAFEQQSPLVEALDTWRRSDAAR